MAITLPWDGKRRYRFFKDQRDAKDALIDMLIEIRKGSAANAGKITVGAYLDEWLESERRRLAPKAQENYEVHIRLRLKPTSVVLCWTSSSLQI